MAATITSAVWLGDWTLAHFQSLLSYESSSGSCGAAVIASSKNVNAKGIVVEPAFCSFAG